MEIIDRYDTNTYRAVYTVQFSNVIYTCCMPSRRNPRAALQPQKRILNSSAADSRKLSGLTVKGALNNGD